jgi:hypothetical protein
MSKKLLGIGLVPSTFVWPLEFMHPTIVWICILLHCCYTTEIVDFKVDYI